MDWLNAEDIKNKKIALAVCTQITIVGIKNMFVQAIPSLYARNSMLNMILLVVVAVLYVNAFFSLDKVLTIDWRVFTVAAFLIISYIISFTFFSDNTVYILDELPRSLPYCFVTCYMLTNLTDLCWLEYYMRRYTPILVFCGVLASGYIYTIGHITTSTWSSYSMPLSYVTMTAVMWALMFFFKEEKIRWIFLAIIGCIIIIAYGSRNPLIAIAVFLIISVIRKSMDHTLGRKAVFYWIFCFVVVIVAWRINDVISLLGNVMESLGISSRTLTLLSADSLSTSGRDTIHAALWAALNEHPFIGLGVAGDQTALYAVGMTQSAHSLYLSILSNYGYIVGGLVLIVLVYWCVKALRISNKAERNILIMYMCMVWPRGFTGGDVWSSDVFWWMLGIVLTVLIYKERQDDNLASGNEMR